MRVDVGAIKAAAAASAASYRSFADATRSVLDLLERLMPGCALYLSHLDRAHAVHTLGCSFGRQLAGVVADEPRQRDHTVIRRDADCATVDLGIPVQLPDDGFSHLEVRIGEAHCCHCRVLLFASRAANSHSWLNAGACCASTLPIEQVGFQQPCS